MPDSNSLTDRILTRWMQYALHYRLIIVLLMIVASGLSLAYTVNNLTVNTDTRDMLSRDLGWRQLDLAYEDAFPMYVNNIVVVVEAPTPDQATDAARHLGQQLHADGGEYEEIYQPGELEFFRTGSLLYLDRDELQALADRLARIQPFLGQLTDDPSLRGLFGLVQQAVEARRDGDDVAIEPLLRQMTAVIEADLAGERRHLSWQRLISGDADSGGTAREYLFIKPHIDYNSLLPGEAAIQSLRAMIRDAELDERYGARARLTGNATLAYEELESVSEGAGIAALAALIVVTLILIVGLRSVRMVFAAVVTLLCGLLLTAGMATLTVGELNLISVAFAVLYIGLGVDFAIHFCLRFRELHAEMDIPAALRRTGTSVGQSLFICALTTAIGLYAFIPTDYRGIAELGWISGTGMFISLFVTLTLLPALLAILAPAGERPRPQRPQPLLDRLARLPQSHGQRICLIALLLAVVAASLLPAVRFDANTLNLQADSKESVQTYRDLIDDSDASPLSGILLTRDAGAAKQWARELETLPEVRDVRTLWDFIPANQADKLAIIDDLSLLLGPTLMTPTDTADIGAAARRQALTDLLAYLEAAPPQTSEPLLRDFHQQLLAFDRQIEQQPDEAAARLATLENRLLQNLPGRLQQLNEALGAENVDKASLPAVLRDRWLSPDGWYLVDIQPSEALDSEAAMRDFVTALRAQTDDLIGAPVIQLEAGDSVVDAFTEAFILAFTVIGLLLLLLLRSLRDTLLALAPIALAALLTAAGTVLLEIPFNFANIIALPLLLGIGIDNSIHLLQRQRTAPADGALLRSSTSQAVLISALTTICSIGNLAFSAHAGTASMGLLLTLGISISLVCALLLLPSLLALLKGRTE
ncbi:hopanoid biosynthesis associated RND transporter like protein HpnN [Methylohalomonas lacus]|uniref:Hopanoid biosynthesis associated RND transporter like protein HpnN n=1 Tax=Methylohalomonas lacus TaxID=398773 RepID=A0AAE3HIH0_9GAMM|nr:MMPL family transporter [Methylohalomonas lacus]MCS3902929.1 hopanoid biosynthesis associated RND transporter like protein HpnN [Methylohalomonas lacus]